MYQETTTLIDNVERGLKDCDSSQAFQTALKYILEIGIFFFFFFFFLKFIFLSFSLNKTKTKKTNKNKTGNFLNYKTRNGNAKAFKLTTLRKLRDARSTTDKKITLLHFIVDTFDKLEEVKGWGETLESLELAAKVLYLHLYLYAYPFHP